MTCGLWISGVGLLFLGVLSCPYLDLRFCFVLFLSRFMDLRVCGGCVLARTEGYCQSCRRWVDRESMIAANITVFGSGVDEKKEVIRFRFCKNCFSKQRNRWMFDDDGGSLVWEFKTRER